MIRIPRTKRGLTAYLFAIAMLTFSLFATANSPTPKQIAKAPSPTTIPTQEQAVLGQTSVTARVTRVIDGDTFEIESGQKVRLIGIDTPETVDPRKPVECFGKEASDHTKSLILNKDVRLVKDVSETDSFGRLLRYVYVDDTFVNKSLIAEGFAFARSYPPDVAHQEEFRATERESVMNHKGLWGSGCSTKRK